MKLNRVERWLVMSPLRRLLQSVVVQWFRAHAVGSSFGSVLEIGCGNGVGARMIQVHFKPGRLYLTDLDREMVRRAASGSAACGHPAILFCNADAAHLPFKNASMDTVFGFGFLHHVPAWKKSMAEIDRVLKPGGTYFFEEYYPTAYQNWVTRRLLVHPEKDRFHSAELREALAGAGLRLQQTFELKRFGIIGIAAKML